MSETNNTQTEASLKNDNSNKTEETPKKKHPCCVCKDTRRIRDECVATHGMDFPKCLKLIEEHKQCMRDEGFNVMSHKNILFLFFFCFFFKKVYVLRAFMRTYKQAN